MNLIGKIKSTFSNTRGWFLLCLCSIAVGLSLSKPLMSLGLFGLLIVWLIDGNIKQKINAFWQNKTAVIISSIYLITVLGLIHTSNFEFAIDDLRRKLPLFFIPFYVSGFSPITKKELHFILKVFIGGVIIATFWSYFVYLGGLNEIIVDARDYSRFNSHIRFGLEIALAIFFGGYFFIKSKKNMPKFCWFVLSLWLVTSLFLFSLFTGVIVSFLTGFVILFFFGITNTNRKLKTTALFIFIIFLSSGGLFIKSSINNFYTDEKVNPIKEIPLTKEGNKYRVDQKTKNSTLKENGYFVEKHISDKEFANAWENKSSINYEGQDLKGNDIKFTLRRFITSKGLRKDKQSIDSLNEKEVKAIEKGIPNAMYLNMNYISIRIHKVLWEYESYINHRNMNGHSVLMRWTYWETASKIIKNNLFFGVGSGDVQDAFNLQYENDNSILTEKYRLRTHNQYLTYGVSFGLIGLIWFVVSLFYPFFKTNKYKNYFYLAFFSIILSSMLTEDTLEVQTGINFFVFFNTLFLLNLQEKRTSINNDTK
ncbi:MAG: O-antigen ligase family protein [Flavobacteriales bacterium]|nr:O-antigen ligase family protein [Flavobacteriales bacterium]